MSIVKGAAAFNIKNGEDYTQERARARELASLFESQMRAFQRRNFEESHETMLYWHESFYDILKNDAVETPPEETWLRPSMIGSDERALWYNLNGFKSDEELAIERAKDLQPDYKTRWQGIGTVVGDFWQKQVLSAEFWSHKLPTVKFDFAFLRLHRNYGHGAKYYPAFEEFTRTTSDIEGVPVHGTCDGVLEYVPEHENLGRDYQGLRIGFEIKSKQTTYASTGHYSMKGEDPKHVQQAKTYALMYGLDYYFFVYQNCSKKGWNISPDDQAKYPDLRVFGIYISPEEKAAHTEYLRKLYNLKDSNELPKLDLLRWNFNSHKEVITANLTSQDMEYLIDQRNMIVDGKYSAFEKRCAADAYEDIVSRLEGREQS
ncbi:Uncharacterized protein B5E38_5013 [Bacillus cereus]|nr:Uncharacterized protein B5E38_5013 [Bacillus cereus]ARO65099.1 Uncharacterized protein B5E39_2728 [Bacillus cereus]